MRYRLWFGIAIASAVVVLSGSVLCAQSPDGRPIAVSIGDRSQTPVNSVFGGRATESGPIARSVERAAKRLAVVEGAAHSGQPRGRPRASGNWIHEHPVEMCALIGAAVGILAGLEVNNECKNSSCSAQALIGIPLYGAGIGAVSGLIIKLTR